MHAAAKASSSAEAAHSGATAETKTASAKSAATAVAGAQQIPLWAEGRAAGIQFSLKVNAPGDRYEQEADRVAEQIMRMPDPQLQRKCACGGAAGPDGECAACHQKRLDRQLQRSTTTATTVNTPPVASPLMHKAESDSGIQASSGLAFSLSATKGGGSPLPDGTRSFMENAFGADFSHVRIHTSGQAAKLSQGIQARAFTHGSDVYFNSGEYQPGSLDGRRLLAHELAHVVQQESSTSTLPKIQRRELNVGLGWRLFNRRGPGDWYFSDRMQWQQASVGGYISSLPQANTFIMAAIYNTRNLRDGEYQNVEQRHNYYDLISYAIEHDPNTPAAARGVRFFHATTLVTGSPGIGTVDSPVGAAMLRQDTRIILREVNAELFRFNMGIIRELLFNWREPRSPQSPAGRIGAFEFDIQMVETEQSRVENYIRREQARFTPQVTQDINDTMDPSAFGQSFNPSQRSFQWAKQALGVSNLDFTNQEHRKAIGFATVHIFHRKTLQEYSAFMQSRVRASAPQSPIQPKLTVNTPGDKYEQEADRVAEQVMRMPEEDAQEQTCACGEPARPDGMCEACRQKQPNIQRKTTGEAGQSTAPPIVHQTLQQPGRPLDPDTRSFMESRFGYGFSHVRVHTGGEAASSASSVNARAYTVGQDIVFGAGQYQSGTRQGKRLLAHELTHVVQQASSAPTGMVQRDEKKGTTPTAPLPQTQDEEWVRLQVTATGMDHAAKLLAEAKLTSHRSGTGKRNNVFIGLHPKFIKVYGPNGNALGKRIKLKEVKGLKFEPGVYLDTPGGMVALTTPDDKNLSFESGPSKIGERPFTEEEKAAIAEDKKKADAEGRPPMPVPNTHVVLSDLIEELERVRLMIASVPDAEVIYFVPTYKASGEKGKGGGTGVYGSPIESRYDGQEANAPPWPVTMDGLKLAPIDSNPTFSANIDWTANGNNTLSSQVISQVGATIFYRWELFDITKYAKQQIAKEPAAAQNDLAARPEKSLEERIEEFKKSKTGTGTDVTGMGGANREFTREFEDWWKDTKRAAKGAVEPGGDTVRERMSNAVANRLSLELAPVSLVVTSLGAVLSWLTELFAGPRQQQEIPLKTEGIFLVRVITTPAINEDTQGNPIIRPPSVAAKVTEVAPMEKAVQESLDEPGAQLAELQAQIDLAEAAGNKSKADYLRSLLVEAKLRFEGSPLDLLIKKRDEKLAALEKFRKDYPTLSDYSRAHEVDMLDDQIALYQHHESQRTKGRSDLGPLRRVNATLISEVTGEQYPLLLSAGAMAMDDGKHQWMISDITNREGDAFTGIGDTPSTAFHSALTKFGGKAAYGRGSIGVRTAGLGLEESAPTEIIVESAPADWALAEKRIDDLVMTLAALGLVVASAGTASALIGAAMAASRLIERWQAGKLYLDAQTVGDVLGLFGGVGVTGQLASGLRVQKFEKIFTVVQDGKASQAQFARAAEALKGAQQLAKAVEIANEAINYGGLLWGNVAFMDQMLSINEQERTGAITHAAARRQRASAISSAVQNNGLFIAGNVMKAKQSASKAKSPEPIEATAPSEKVIPTKPTTTDSSPGEKVPGDEPPRQGSEEPASKTPQPEPTPIGERQATPAELKAALPNDLQNMLIVDASLHGDTVKAEYKIDPATGLISEISLRCSSEARPVSVALHTETIRTMQKYQGFSGRVRQAISWVADLIGFDTLDPHKNPLSFEAALEVRKLPQLIDAQMARMKNMEPNARNLAEAELEHLQVQLDKHNRTLGLGEEGEAAGFVAAKGLSKADQKRYDDLATKLRSLKPGSDEHKDIRWKMYGIVGGDLPQATWERIYQANVNKPTKASATVEAEQKRLGWGKMEQTVDVSQNEARRLDIANVLGKKGIEVKAYESGYITAESEIVSEVERDRKLIKSRGWEITWILIDTAASAPLLKLLNDAGITVEYRTRGKSGSDTKLISVIRPRRKQGAKATM